jgi:hypothetical protein
MGKHRRTPHVGMQVRTVPEKALTDASHNESLGRTARGIAVLALVLGSLGAEAVATHQGHVGAGQLAGTRHSETGYQLTGSGRTSDRPWMY